MRVRLLAPTASIASGAIMIVMLAQSLSSSSAQTRSRYLPEYTGSGNRILPKDFYEWVYVESTLTPNALNGGKANLPDFHNVYIEPDSYEIYKTTNVFPDGSILFNELQLTLPSAEFADGSRTEPSGRGYFPRPWNGADGGESIWRLLERATTPCRALRTFGRLALHRSPVSSDPR